ncbi:MAG: tRNA pseudouridine(55) synthase TruB [Armatimonadota bacterium]
MDGILNINKPAGPTSHDIVAKVRRATREKRIGHAGTLDPDASGVLVLCLGKATRIVEYLMDWHKVYRAVAVFGTETTTEDASGDVIAEYDCSHLTRSDIEAVLPRFTGDILQIPPMVSAVHHQGRRLYELAREGKTVERTPRPVTVYSIKMTDYTQNQDIEAVLEIECSRGTYIRTLCADIGKAVNCGAHMGSLIRTGVGRFNIDDAITLDDVEIYANEGRMQEILQSVSNVLVDMPSVTVSDDDAKRIMNGVKLPAESLVNISFPGLTVPVRIIGPGDELLAIGSFVLNADNDMILKPDKVFSGSTNLEE